MHNISLKFSYSYCINTTVFCLKICAPCFFPYLYYQRQHKGEVSGDIFDMLLTFTDFMAFKEMFLDYRAVSTLSVQIYVRHAVL